MSGLAGTQLRGQGAHMYSTVFQGGTISFGPVKGVVYRDICLLLVSIYTCISIEVIIDIFGDWNSYEIENNICSVVSIRLHFLTRHNVNAFCIIKILSWLWEKRPKKDQKNVQGARQELTDKTCKSRKSCDTLPFTL